MTAAPEFCSPASAISARPSGGVAPPFGLQPHRLDTGPLKGYHWSRGSSQADRARKQAATR